MATLKPYPANGHNPPQRSAADPQRAERTPDSAYREAPCSRSLCVGIPSPPVWGDSTQSVGVALSRDSRSSRGIGGESAVWGHSTRLCLHCCLSYLTGKS